MLKRFAVLFLIVLMSINSFAGIVNDNDGSAFVTKAELEELKKGFANQITNYNTSIDSKIDGAIASYLEGVRLSEKVPYTVEHQTGSDKWDYVKMMNFTPVEIEQVPNLNLNFGVFGSTLYYNATYRMCWYTNADLKYKASRSSTATRNRKNCVDLGTEVKSMAEVSNECGWRGRSYDLEDAIIAYKELSTPKLWRTASTAGDAVNTGYLRGPQYSSFNVVRALQFNSGYFNTNNIYQNWKATVFYDYNNNGLNLSDGDFYADGESWTDYAKAAINTAIKLNKVNEESYYDKHILNWKTLSYQSPTEPAWSSWLGGLKTISQKDTLSSAVTKMGIWGVHENGYYVDTNINRQYYTTPSSDTNDNRTYYHQAFGGWNSGEYRNEVTTDLKGVGVVEKTFTSDAILQWFKEGTENTYELNRDMGKGINTVKKMNLLNGYLVGSLKSGDTFEWEPTISGYYFPYAKDYHFHSYTKNGTTYYQYGDYCLDGNCTNTAHHVTAVPKWRIVLATCYFGEGTNLLTNKTIDGENNGKILKEKNQTTDYKELDNGGKVKFEFTVEDDCIVVAKWYPVGMKLYGTTTDLGFDDCYWYGNLDLTQCGTYYATGE